jgi:hypothetical protein
VRRSPLALEPSIPLPHPDLDPAWIAEYRETDRTRCWIFTDGRAWYEQKHPRVATAAEVQAIVAAAVAEQQQ